MSDAPALLVHGAGRMGRLVAESAGVEQFTLAAVISPTQPHWLESGPWHGGLDSNLPGASLMIDFSSPDGAVAAARWCADHGTALVSGTTGMDQQHMKVLAEAATRIPVLWAANFSIGVNLCEALARLAAKRLGDCEVRISDIHHVHKKDAPSGTALALGAASGHADVRYESRREGEVIGEHRVCFATRGEQVEISHVAHDRGIYARGALSAALWLNRQAPGLYRASDWLAAESG